MGNNTFFLLYFSGFFQIGSNSNNVNFILKYKGTENLTKGSTLSLVTGCRLRHPKRRKVLPVSNRFNFSLKLLKELSLELGY